MTSDDDLHPTFQVCGDLCEMAAAVLGPRAAVVIVIDADGYLAIGDIKQGARLRPALRTEIIRAALVMDQGGKPEIETTDTVRPGRA